jgi:flagellar motility protein MotE (MotC chaperone)
MRRLLLPSLLILVTSIAVVKTGFSFMQRSEARLAATEQEQQSDTVVLMDSLAANGAATMQVLGDQLIPSAEAAASMTIAEESFSAPAERELLESLRATREKLAEMEKSLSEREKEAEAAERKAAERITELEQLETRIQDLLQQEESIKSKKIKRLTAVYEGMKAEKAAPVIAQMELVTVVKMFSRMNEKQVGKILSFLPPEKAVIISHALTKQISKVGP